MSLAVPISATATSGSKIRIAKHALTLEENSGKITFRLSEDEEGEGSLSAVPGGG